jgi:hypothetical protein
VTELQRLLTGFPIKYSTLRTLPRGHYLKLDISPGHYAAKHHNFCFKKRRVLLREVQVAGDVTVRRIS